MWDEVIDVNMMATAHFERPANGWRTENARCVLDLVHLSRHTLGDRVLETELLELFDRQAASALARLTSAIGARGAAGADIAHMLKGSARAVGAFGVSGAAEQVEDALRAAESPAVALQGLTAAVVEARQTIAALLG